jgi:hypothetical protein
MAAVTTTEPYVLEPAYREPVAPLGSTAKLSWGALFGAGFVVIALDTLLGAVGFAVGLSSVDPHRVGTVKGAAIGIGLWLGISSILALFVGGILASRTAGIVDRTMGAIHGAVLWGLTTVFVLFLLVGAARGVGPTATAVGAGFLSSAGPVAMDTSGPGQEGAMQGPAMGGVSQEEMTTAINEQLSDEGKPPIPAAVAQSIYQQVMGSSRSEGRFDRDTLLRQLTSATPLSGMGARRVVEEMDQAYSGGRVVNPDNVRVTVLRALDKTGRAMWWIFVGLLLELGAGVLGAALGVTRPQRLAAKLPVPLQGPPLGAPHPYVAT